PEGKISVYNENGFLIQKGNYHLGKEEGEWNFLSEDGQLKFIGSYHDGKEIGIWYEFKKGRKKVYKKY
ncbi:MAG: toxin-antitoxin system YwqK family antitoxin, partial [Bacteroidetes bacterium]|nr:toxin-antitoxin system YwqK family antitoxin [Bacteroidota bacterium]